jgi:hypothetical protein
LTGETIVSKPKTSRTKPARKRQPKQGELADEALDQVSGGGKSNAMKANSDTQNTLAQALKA